VNVYGFTVSLVPVPVPVPVHDACLRLGLIEIAIGIVHFEPSGAVPLAIDSHSS